MSLSNQTFGFSLFIGSPILFPPFFHLIIALRKSGVSIGGATYYGVFIYPDNYSGDVVSDSMTWDQINAAGIVFLPAAGDHLGSGVSNVGYYGYYWSSTASNGSEAYHVYYSNGSVSPGYGGNRISGFSVRLITECQ